MILFHEKAEVRLSDLVLSDYNPRLMPDGEMGKLMRSIEHFGFVQPVVARKEDLLVVGGHQRVTALRKLAERDGQDPAKITIPAVLIPGLTDDRAKLLNIALNKIGGEWDYKKLSELFNASDADDDVLELSGFPVKDIESIRKWNEEMSIEPNDPSLDPLEGLAEQARHFSFWVESEEDADLVNSVLTKFGMTSPGSMGFAFVNIAEALQGVRP